MAVTCSVGKIKLSSKGCVEAEQKPCSLKCVFVKREGEEITFESVSTGQKITFYARTEITDKEFKAMGAVEMSWG